MPFYATPQAMETLPGDYELRLRVPASKAENPALIEADIIFVHGTNSDPQQTWTYADHDSHVDWVEDPRFMPKMFPRCRIFTFEWNACFIDYSYDADLKNIASNLLWRIDYRRKSLEERHRKLIFITHGFGGRIVQRALTLEMEGIQHRKEIQGATVGIIAMGTLDGHSFIPGSPFRTIVFPSLLQLWKGFTALSPSQPNFVGKFTRTYVKRRNDPSRDSLDLFSFRETNVPFPFYLSPQSSAIFGLEGETSEKVLNKDHRNLVRFKSPNDPTFRKVAHYVQKLVEKPIRFETPARESASQALIHKYAPLEAPLFVGHDGYLAMIHKLLWNPSIDDTDRHVAVWGQRGMAKTEIVLRYARIHRHEYDTIVWLNSSAEDLLISKMEEFYDYLSSIDDPTLKDMAKEKFKYQTVIAWFQKQERCLIVYDKVDPNNSFDLRKYFPQCARAHRIVIGLNSSLAPLAHFNFEVTEMSDEDAIKMFRSIGGVPEDASEDTQQTLLSIVHKLDKTPFYINFGAIAFRTSLLPLRQFLERIADFRDGSDMWAMAYQKLQDNPDSMMLLKFFAFLDGSDIRRDMLKRCGTSRKRWGEDGELVLLTPHMNGVDVRLAALLSDEKAFDAALAPLSNESFVRRRQNGTISWIEIRPLVQEFVIKRMPEDERLRWLKKVVCAVAHALPEDGCLEENLFERLRIIIIPHVLWLVKLVKNHEITRGIEDFQDIHETLTFMLLSSVGRSIMDKSLLDFVDSLLRFRHTLRLRCLSAKWRAYLAFLGDDIRVASDRLAETRRFEQMRMEADPKLSTPRNKAVIGEVIIHLAQCLFAQRRYHEAQGVLESWNALSASTLENRTHRLIKTALARILYLLGDIDRAQKNLEDILPLADSNGNLEDTEDFNWPTITLAHIYCVKRDYQQALDLVEPKTEWYMEQDRVLEFATSDYRLILCEALLRKHQYPEFEEQLTSLQRHLQLPAQKGNPRASTQLLMAKKLRARSFYFRAQWPQALNSWKRILARLGLDEDDIKDSTFAETYRDDYDVLETVFYIALCHFQLGDKPRARTYVEVVTRPPMVMRYPGGEIDYTQSVPFLEAQWAALNSKKRRRGEGGPASASASASGWSWFSGLFDARVNRTDGPDELDALRKRRRTSSLTVEQEGMEKMVDFATAS